MRTLDVPQANDLDSVRAVVRAVAQGAAEVTAIADFTGYSLRHTRYRLHAARVLGLLHVDGDTAALTTDGERLLDAALGSDEERRVYHDVITRSPTLQILAPDLLGRSPPLLDDLSARLFELARLSRNTAVRRAGGLLTWRRRVLGEVTPAAAQPPPFEPQRPPEQLDLFG